MSHSLVTFGPLFGYFAADAVSSESLLGCFWKSAEKSLWHHFFVTLIISGVPRLKEAPTTQDYGSWVVTSPAARVRGE